ncbi:calcium-binding protein [Microvirga arsenatis]|uniref:Cadherin domain-containing protein n=1 Tax=Microvirga arsenatis TaxID=2692265 RepID=A0ABW9Z0J7_9HYPH|nr:hypothetical protein [Microvirga arsenatis]NBJ12378.1 hypothetical protein [Microvirga arsenatis]NBJ26169.1 hypothetical protein [Microvirga arsenatis]
MSSETRVNTTISDEQFASSITTLANGGWIVTWVSNGTDGHGLGIYQQRYDEKGRPVGGEIRVNTSTAGDQAYPSVTALSDGGWIVTWQSARDDSSGWDIYQQRFNPRGIHAEHETRVNTVTSNNQSDASVTTLSDRGWIVTWTSSGQDGSGAGVYQQRYSSSGQPVGHETRVNTTTNGVQDSASVTELADGGWLVTWTSFGQDGSGLGIYQQRYDANGAPVGVEQKVNSFTAGHQRDSSVTALPNGRWVITWSSDGQDGSVGGVYQQRYDVTGGSMGNEVRVNTTTVNSQMAPQVTTLKDGGWLVVWASYDQDGDMFGIYQQRYDATGQTVGGEARVNTTTSHMQYMPSVSALPDGGWVISWTSDGQDGSGQGIYQQRFNKDGQKIGPTTPTGINLSGLKVNEGGHLSIDVGDLAAEALVTDGSFTYLLLDDAGGRFEIAGNRLKLKDHVKLDYEQAQFHAIKVLVQDATGATCEKSFTISVTDVQEENLTGNSHSNVIKGGQYRDAFNGADGDDILWGGNGNDVLTGGSGRDIFVFNTVLGSARNNKSKNLDTIGDFKVADDTVWLDNAVFKKLGKGSESGPGKLKKAFFTIGEEAKDRNDYLIYNKKNGKLYYDADGSGAKAAIEFAKLKKGLGMTEKDFFII